MAGDIHRELEDFRREWKEEVTAKSRVEDPVRARGGISSSPGRKARPQFPERRQLEDLDELARGYDLDHVRLGKGANASTSSPTGRTLSKFEGEGPLSALEHYEKGVERETQGNLGDSLTHYRKAYRMNDRVDQEYKKKHFPAALGASTASRYNPSNASPTVPSTAHHSLHGPSATTSATTEPLADLFEASIQPAHPAISDTGLKTCPIANLPLELLAEVLSFAALSDVASLARLSLVCKRLAYVISTEDRIWRRICAGKEYGFGSMRYIFGHLLRPIDSPPPDPSPLPDLSMLAISSTTAPSIPRLVLSTTYPTFRGMFRARPRIRFAGVYISTVNYTRPGASSPNQVTWNTPVHIVTYYRYLRFYRDGSAISLLSTSEPGEVVPYLHAHNLPEEGGSRRIDPEAGVMKQALRGRWRMAPLAEATAGSGEGLTAEPEGNVLVETTAPAPAYTYSMYLALRSGTGSSGPRNTKLAWRGFWSYNRLTDDWAEFQLRNDRAFVWSRVRSWADA